MYQGRLHGYTFCKREMITKSDNNNLMTGVFEVGGGTTNKVNFMTT
jgi:hypothetical protein